MTEARRPGSDIDNRFDVPVAPCIKYLRWVALRLSTSAVSAALTGPMVELFMTSIDTVSPRTMYHFLMLEPPF